MDNDWIDNDEDINDSNNCELSKNEVIKLLLSQDTQIDLIAPKKFKSPIWERFRLVYFRGNFYILFDLILQQLQLGARCVCAVERNILNGREEHRTEWALALLSRSVIRELRCFGSTRRQQRMCRECSKQQRQKKQSKELNCDVTLKSTSSAFCSVLLLAFHSPLANAAWL